MPRENDLEGPQDMGGKHGGQAGKPKSPPRPPARRRDEDVLPKRKDVETVEADKPQRKGTAR